MGNGFAGSEVRVALQRLGGTRVIFLHARTPTHSPPDVKNREEHSPLAMHTAVFVHVLVLLAAGLTFYYGESNEHSEQARAPHTNGPRDVPRCGALSLLKKNAALQGG